MADPVKAAIAAGQALAARWGEPLTLDTLLAGCREVVRAERSSIRAGELYEAARFELEWAGWVP